jgi:hypothetical protein
MIFICLALDGNFILDQLELFLYTKDCIVVKEVLGYYINETKKVHCLPLGTMYILKTRSALRVWYLIAYIIKVWYLITKQKQRNKNKQRRDK